MTGPAPESRDPLDLLAEQFLSAQRRGEPVDVEVFAAQHPEHGDALRELLPTLQALEHVKREKESTGGARARVSLAGLQRLGDFRIVREIGRGGMGVVFEAIQESLGRRVALKVLPQASLLTGNQLDRFRREAQIAAQLHHSNIVPVFGSGESDGYHWYAMQYIAGQGLDRWRLQQAEMLPQGSGAWRARARFVARLGVQAAQALHCAHGQGTLHRDVKPGNLLLEGEDKVWVTDFGLAKALEAEGLTHSGDLLGTLQYMAPEQFEGRYDVRSEVYALGVTLYELLVLRPAFAAKSRSELMERIRTQRAEGLRRACPELPEDLAVVVERAMAREPGDRYADASAFAQDLQAFLDDRPIAARRQGAVGLLVRWCRRNRLLAALAASTLLAGIAAGVVGWVAYVATDAARRAEAQQRQRADTNLARALTAFGDVFDALVGRDPTLALEEDPETGEPTVIARTVVDPAAVELLQKMLRFLDGFAADNAENQSLRFETARANRRVGAIHVRLGKPENLDAARQAYDRALLLLEQVTARDVTREIAAVHVDYGRLEQRRPSLGAAALRFQKALLLLEQDADAESRPVRFERAQAHFLSAQLADRTAQVGPRAPLAPGGPGGPGGDPRGRIVLGSKQHAQAALQLVGKLLEEEPENREFLALQARCLLLNLPGRPGEARRERPADPQADAQREQGLAILRDLVQKNPAAELWRYELCSAIVDGQRRDERRPGRMRREPGPATEVTDAMLAALREAKGHAEQLVKDQPRMPEYQMLRGEVGRLLGTALRDRADGLPAAEQHAVRRSAKAELETALAVLRGLVPEGEPADPRHWFQLVWTNHALVGLCLTLGERVEAAGHASAWLDLVEAQVTLLERLPRPGRQWPPFVALLPERLLGEPAFGDRVRALQRRIERLLPPAPPDRPGPDRRGGR